MNRTDRQRILARRAAFVGTALAALGACTRETPAGATPPETPRRTVVDVEEPPEDSVPSDAALPDAGAPSSKVSAAPSLEVPDDTSPEAKRRYEELAERMRTVYAIFDRLDVPADCQGSDASCDGRLRKLADDLLELRDRTRYIIPVCAGSSEHAKRFGARAREHDDYVKKLQAELEAKIQRMVEAGGAALEKRWQEQQRAARMARPSVCLSFGCMDW